MFIHYLMMKKLSKSKNYLFVIGYWLLFVIIPYIIALLIAEMDYSYKAPDVIVQYIIYDAPILYLIPLLLADLPTIKSKIMFVVWGFILPILAMLLFFLFSFFQTDITLF